jgi:phosphate-selective porin OprO/OprP
MIYSNVENSLGNGNYGLWGGYAQASWMLTGEEAGYNQLVGIPERIIPNKDFSSKAGTWGAWQLAGRASYLDLNDGAVDGGRGHQYMLGLNWWWNRFFRWQLNYGYAIIEGGPTPGHLQLLQLRAQLMY